MAAESAKPTTVDEYLADFPAATRVVLARVRRTLRKALPGAEEVISYSIPAYRLNGRIAIYFAGWLAHFSLYPISRGLTAALEKQLAPFKMSGKGTIRFPLADPVPTAVIEAIAKFRVEEMAAVRKKPARTSGKKARTRTVKR